jgi:hypothetical protein
VNSTYLLRLVLLCCASFFLVYLAASLAVALLAPAVIRVATSMAPRAAARLLFSARMLPLILAALVMLALCLPSYLWLEPQNTPENVGIGCLLAAFMAVGLASVSLMRAGSTIIRSNVWTRNLATACRVIRVPVESCEVSLVEMDAPLLGLAGVLRPQVVVSTAVLRALSPEQFGAALRHEQVHRTARDNFKRLLLILAPEVWPLSARFTEFERQWTKFSEWAADDEATNDDARKRLDLAAALLCVARLGSPPRQGELCTSLVADDHDFAARVLRLVEDPAPTSARSLTRIPTFFLSGAALLAVCGMAAAILRPTALYAVHRLLEQLIR